MVKKPKDRETEYEYEVSGKNINDFEFVRLDNTIISKEAYETLLELKNRITQSNEYIVEAALLYLDKGDRLNALQTATQSMAKQLGKRIDETKVVSQKDLKITKIMGEVISGATP